jgi:hypothetical protein
VEKSVLVLVLGRMLNRVSEIYESISTKPFTIKAFNFEEFKDQDFVICDHLIYYLNECHVNKYIDNESEVWIVYIEVIIFIAFCVVGITCFIKSFKKISNSTDSKPNQSQSNQIQLDPVVLNEILADTNAIAEDEVSEE